MEKIYLALIKKHLRTLESVPNVQDLPSKVKALLDAENLDGNGYPKEEPEQEQEQTLPQ